MTRKFLLLSVAGLFITAAPTSAYYTLPQTQSFSGRPNPSGSLTFSQFHDDSGAWILQSIQVSFTLQSSGGHLTLDNNNNLQQASGYFEFGVGGVLSSTDVNLSNSLNQPIPGQVTACSSQTFNLGPGETLSYDGGIVTATKSGFVGNTFWGDGTKRFLGTGTYSINYYVWLHLPVNSSSEEILFNSNPTPNAFGDVTVVYTYIPEPATITLLTFGGFALLKKKHRKYSSP